MVALRRGKRRSKKPSGTPHSGRAHLSVARRETWLLRISIAATSVAFALLVAANFLIEQDESGSEIGRDIVVFDPGEPLNVGMHSLELFERKFDLIASRELDDAAVVPANTASVVLKKRRNDVFRLADFEQLPKSAPGLAASASGDAPSNSESSDHGFRITYRSGTIERSMFEDRRQMSVLDPVLSKLSEIFGWDIDLALDMNEGDSFLVIYEEKYRPEHKTSEGTILAAEFVNRGKAYRAIGFPGKDGKIEYFTPAGKQLRRTFLRSPVQYSSISSPFSKARYHPILNIWRAHTGIDYAAAPGAPVHATASGRILSVGRNGGYGNTVTIKHKGPYSTLYAHLSRYRQGLQAGDTVEQGEVIGYVGQTGLATGPHLHYEFQVNGHHRNPLAFDAQESEGGIIAPAKREEFLRVARTWTTRLDLLSGQRVASR